MKKKIAAVGLSGLIILGLSSMKNLDSVISGKVIPATAVEAVLVIKDADTLRTTVGKEGDFTLPVSPGTYRLLVDAKEPYRDAEMKELVVKAESAVNVGEIKLDK